MTTSTSAGKKYLITMAICMTFYIIGLFGSIYFIKWANPSVEIKYALAFAPALPIGFTILAVLKFMRDSDEYIRAYHVDKFVKATGLTLFLCTVWGFMENFADAPHVELWWVYPVFWGTFGLVGCFPMKRN